MADSHGTTMDADRKRLGRLGEGIACKFLLRKGYSIVQRNFRKKWGEIDVVASRDNIVHIVEVKAVSEKKFSREIHHQPEEMVDRRKLRKLARTAALYMETMNDRREYQIDVVAVHVDEESRTSRCRLIEQALEDNL